VAIDPIHTRDRGAPDPGQIGAIEQAPSSSR
jgi:hypothetical protein